MGVGLVCLLNHLASKKELLFEIMETVLLQLLEDQRQVPAAPDAVEAMRLLVLSAATRTGTIHREAQRNPCAPSALEFGLASVSPVRHEVNGQSEVPTRIL